MIIAPIHTFARRRKPEKSTSWRVEFSGLINQQATLISKTSNWVCLFILRGCFNLVWVDEAHETKRHDSNQSLALHWPYAEFTGLTTATPGLNRTEGVKDYLKFCQRRREIPAEE